MYCLPSRGGLVTSPQSQSDHHRGYGKEKFRKEISATGVAKFESDSRWVLKEDHWSAVDLTREETVGREDGDERRDGRRKTDDEK